MTAEIITLRKTERICSFCKTPESMAKKLIASTVTSHCICDACAKLAKERLEERSVT